VYVVGEKSPLHSLTEASCPQHGNGVLGSHERRFQKDGRLTGNRDPRRSDAPTPLASTQIVPRYAQVMDQNRLGAMKKLEELKKSASTSQEAAESAADEAADGMR